MQQVVRQSIVIHKRLFAQHMAASSQRRLDRRIMHARRQADIDNVRLLLVQKFIKTDITLAVKAAVIAQRRHSLFDALLAASKHGARHGAFQPPPIAMVTANAAGAQHHYPWRRWQHGRFLGQPIALQSSQRAFAQRRPPKAKNLRPLIPKQPR